MSKFKPNSRSTLASPAPRKTYGRDTAVAATAVLTPEPAKAEPVDLRSEPVEPQGSAIQRIGFICLLLFIVFKFSFFHEWLDSKVHADLHLVIIVSLLPLLAAVGSGRMMEAFRDKLTWIWIGFAFCMGLATVTSAWPGGSFIVLMSYLRTCFPIIFILPALTVTKKDLGRLFGALGVACVIAVGLGFSNSDFKTGRMSLDEHNSGELTNSNDYAAFLIVMLPALAYFTLRPGRPIGVKVLGFLLIGISLYEILSTGSRGGLVAVAVMLIYTVLTATSRVRIGILVAVPVLALAAIPFVPRESMDRLKTLVSSDVPATGEAVESKEARIELLKASLQLTFEHPLTGIGPDQFMISQAADAKENGQRGMWHVTHNTYTQISSECGIPGALLFISAAVLTLTRFFRLRKHPDQELALIASVGTVMTLGYCISIFFLSMAYSIQILVMGAMAVSAASLGRRYDPPSPTRATAT